MVRNSRIRVWIAIAALFAALLEWWRRCRRGAWHWVPAGLMSQRRRGHAATALADGRVLVVGGHPADADDPPLPGAEVWDPGTDAWSAVGPMAVGRSRTALVTLHDGRVMVVGGWIGTTTTADCELFDPATGTWAPTGAMHVSRTAHAAAVLADGRVLVAGGFDHPSGDVLSSVEVYDPAVGLWTPTTGLSSPRQNLVLAVLPDDTVLAAGGDTGTSGSSVCERYDPATAVWAPSGAMTVDRSDDDAGSFGAALLTDGRVVAAAGFGGPASWYLDSAEVYDPGPNTWSAIVSLPGDPRVLPGVAPLPDGAALVVGGWTGDLPLADAYRWPGAGGWQTLPSLTVARGGHTATALPGGDVVVAGGFAPGADTAAAERLTRRRACLPWHR